MIAICSSRPSTASERARRVVGRRQPRRQLAPASRRAARACWPARRRPRTGARVGRNTVQIISAPIATPPQFSANSMRLCRLVVITNDSTWKSRVRQPIRKQKKQKKQIANQSAASSGSDDHEEEREQPRDGRAPEHRVVREDAGVRVELAEPGDAAQQIADQHQREEDPAQRQRARIDARDRCGAAP